MEEPPDAIEKRDLFFRELDEVTSDAATLAVAAERVRDEEHPHGAVKVARGDTARYDGEERNARIEQPAGDVGEAIHARDERFAFDAGAFDGSTDVRLDLGKIVDLAHLSHLASVGVLTALPRFRGAHVRRAAPDRTGPLQRA